MKAWVARELAGPSALEWIDQPLPQPGPGEILIEVAARGVNYADTLMVSGQYPGVKAPVIPGLEAAGTVLTVGAGVTGFSAGERVMGLLRGGGYASHAILRADFTLRVPASFSWEEAGAFPETFFTAWHLLQAAGPLRSGETLLVIAAAGGVGTSLLQLTRGTGIRVLGAASTRAKLDRLRGLAEFQAVEYGEGKLEAHVKEITSGRGVDCALESAGGEIFDQVVECLALGGRLVIYGAASGEFRSVPSHKILGRLLTVTGFHLGRLSTDRPDAVRAARDALAVGIERQSLRPLIGTKLPFSDAPRGLDRIRDRSHSGKIVLVG